MSIVAMCACQLRYVQAEKVGETPVRSAMCGQRAQVQALWTLLNSLID